MGSEYGKPDMFLMWIREKCVLSKKFNRYLNIPLGELIYANQS